MSRNARRKTQNRSPWAGRVFSLFIKDTSAGWMYSVLNLHLPVEGMLYLLTVPPCSPPAQHGQSGRGWTWTQLIWDDSRLSWSDLKRAEQSKKSKTEALIGEQTIAGQSRGKVMGAERRDSAQSSLSVCTAELLLLAHLLHHLDPPPHTHHPPSPALSPSCPPFSLSFYLPVVPFNN